MKVDEKLVLRPNWPDAVDWLTPSTMVTSLWRHQHVTADTLNEMIQVINCFYNSKFHWFESAFKSTKADTLQMPCSCFFLSFLLFHFQSFRPNLHSHSAQCKLARSSWKFRNTMRMQNWVWNLNSRSDILFEMWPYRRPTDPPNFIPTSRL